MGYSGKAFTFKCNRCETNYQVKMTKEERRYYRWEFKQMFNPGGNKVWSAFQKYFFEREKREYTLLNKTFKCWEYLDWKWKGYPLMCKVKKYVEKHPEIVLASCDDNSCMSSTLVLIPHRDPDGGPRSGYWRTTVIFIPQNGGNPAEFSLSGWRERSLIDGLKKVKSST